MITVPRIFSSTAERSPAQLVREMSRWYLLSRAIHVVGELGIADRIGPEPVSILAVASALGLDASALFRLIRFLAAYGIFDEPASGEVRASPLSEVLRSDHPQSVRSSLLRYDEAWWHACGEMAYSIRTGRSAFPHANGATFFEHLAKNPTLQERFDAAMADISRADDAAVSEAYDFGIFHTIVDVGGGRGGLLAEILRRHPPVRGILFDQPQVVSRPDRLLEARLLDRCECVGGDFFQSVPSGGNCYIIKGVLHDFDDQQCVRILRNCASALAAGGRVLVADRIVPASKDGPHEILFIDLQMLVLLQGRERERSEWPPIFARSGLRLVAFHETDADFTLVEGALL
jgi:hypothetical protein